MSRGEKIIELYSLKKNKKDIEFLESKLKKLRNELSSLDMDYSRFKIGTIDLSKGEVFAIKRMMKELEDQFKDNSATLKNLGCLKIVDKRIEELEEILDGQPSYRD